MTNDLVTAREIFRNHVLEAMDTAAREIFGDMIKRNDAGATDADLPKIFPCLDAQLERLSERYHYPFFDFTPAEWEKIRQQKAINAALHGSMP